jgi:predicted RNA-binding Zn-ribbon protein involved in translation (DUF1610 family)
MKYEPQDWRTSKEIAKSERTCPKCGSEMYRCKSWGRRNMRVCIECLTERVCSDEEKVKRDG